MKIWLLSSQSRLNCYENKRFQEETSHFGIKFRIVVPENFDIIPNKSGEDSIFYNSKPIIPPDVFIPRYTLNYFSSAVIRQFEELDVMVLNSSFPRELAKDKLASLQILSRNNLPVPKTILAKFPLKVEFVESQLEYPIIVKRTQGSEGKGIILCENRTQLEDIFELMSSSLDKNVNLILQEFITESKGKDIRVFVVGGRALGAMMRKGKNGDFKANYSGGGSVQKVQLTPELEWLAVEATRTIGLDIAGVDLLFGKDGFKVCEVNNSPYFEGFEKATGINVAQEILNYITVRMGEHPYSKSSD